MFRPKEIQLYNIMVQREYAYDFVVALSTLNVNLLDLQQNVSQQHKEFSNQLKRCDDIMGKLNEISVILGMFGIPISRCPNHQGFLENRNIGADYIGQMEDDITHRLGFLQKQQSNILQVIEKRNKLYEQKSVIICTSDIVSRDEDFLSRMRQQGRLTIDEQGVSVNDQQDKLRKQNVDIKLNCLSGCINSVDCDKFNRLLFRTTKQNAMVKFWTIDHNMIQGNIVDHKNSIQNRSVFFILYASGMQDFTRQKILKICEIFNATFYDLPKNKDQIEIILSQLNREIDSLNEVITETQAEITSTLSYFSDIHLLDQFDELSYDQIYNQGLCSYVEHVRLNLLVEAATYFHLNFFHYKGSIMQGQMWAQPSSVQDLKQNFKQIPFQVDECPDASDYEPPSLLKNNDFVQSFQDLVNTYGYPRYGEINPGLFTIVTFPFLFGIMFGDIGHGSLLACFGIYLLLFGERMVKNTHQENRSDPQECKDISSLYSARYLLTLMGFFACYCGYIYNDYFSTSLNYANSCIIMETSKFAPDCVPFLGLDGAWSLSDKFLAIMNSFKMKTAIIIGVTQMTFGILLKGWNTLYQRKWLDFTFDFIPQLLFMLSTFGYMSFLIIIKWLTFYEDPSKAPSIITTMLTMYFTLGGILGEPMYPNQVQVQQILILICGVTPLLMLYPKPIIKIIIHNRNHRVNDHIEFQDEDAQAIAPIIEKPYGLKKESKAITEEKHFTPMEISIEAAIETIEFVLGAVSNTASYLRLWALSLAHSQLSEVFFDMTLNAQLKSGSVVGIGLAFLVFASITFMVLMCMDTLECFLHSLRLHWVEFQSKFYKADGLQYQPLNYLIFLQNNIEFSSRM